MESDDRPAGSIADLVSVAVRYRMALDRAQGSAARIGDSLAYDVTLARLCERLDIDHELAGENAGPVARRRAESMIAARLPLLASALAGDEYDD